MNGTDEAKGIIDKIDKCIDGESNAQCIEFLLAVADHVVELLQSFGVEY